MSYSESRLLPRTFLTGSKNDVPRNSWDMELLQRLDLAVLPSTTRGDPTSASPTFNTIDKCS
jgi:hypothetical protein